MDDQTSGAARARAALRLAEMHGRISVDAYAYTFDTLIYVLQITDPTQFAREIMKERIAPAGSEEAVA